ncbi:MAG: heavy-metal-associated domain-containing protein [Phycisphaerales bacterium]|nr:heavy-metal-associated domain-containing protein [Phycisphaerales bacterium]
MRRILLLASVALLLAACTARTETKPVRTVQFSIQGMTCNHCVEAITAEMRDVPGVSGCDVSLEGESATVRLTDDAAVPKIVEAVSRLGYEIAPRDSETVPVGHGA